MFPRFGRALLFFSVLITSHALSAEPIPVRGTLPWHNFLSGPSAWNLGDYRRYLDWMKKLDLNLLVLHCYTGGAHRYVNYVEPMVRVTYASVLPDATLDTSLTARWGYRPLAPGRVRVRHRQALPPPRCVRCRSCLRHEQRTAIRSGRSAHPQRDRVGPSARRSSRPRLRVRLLSSGVVLGPSRQIARRTRSAS